MFFLTNSSAEIINWNMKHNNFHVVENPLIRHYLYHLRDESTKPPLFRTLTKKITYLLSFEAAKHIETVSRKVETPLETADGDVIESEIILVPILRAGLGMIDAVLELFPNVNVGYIGMKRDEETAVAYGYYCKLPHLSGKLVFIVDPMLATGGSLDNAINTIKKENPKKIIIISIVSSPEGVEFIAGNHPDVDIYTASLDRELNGKKYILPGLGDFGDRLYGTN
jgi:uracil phosphoribosyltransferase